MEDFDPIKSMMGDTDQLLAELKSAYVTGMSSSLALLNTSLISYLYYKLFFKGNLEETNSFVDTILSGIHKEISDAIVNSSNTTEDYGIIKDEMDAFVSDAKKAMDKSFEEIKESIKDSLTRAIKAFSGTPGEGTNSPAEPI